MNHRSPRDNQTVPESGKGIQQFHDGLSMDDRWPNAR